MIYPSALKKIFLNFLLYQVAEEFKHHARERKFVVREFSYNEADLAAGKNEITKLVTDKKKQFVSIPPNVQLAPSIYGGSCNSDNLRKEKYNPFV